jgi:hypothetical protein
LKKLSEKTPLQDSNNSNHLIMKEYNKTIISKTTVPFMEMSNNYSLNCYKFYSEVKKHIMDKAITQESERRKLESRSKQKND